MLYKDGLSLDGANNIRIENPVIHGTLELSHCTGVTIENPTIVLNVGEFISRNDLAEFKRQLLASIEAEEADGTDLSGMVVEYQLLFGGDRHTPLRVLRHFQGLNHFEEVGEGCLFYAGAYKGE